MFANLFSTFQAWVSTTQGSAAVAAIVIIGMVLTALFVVVIHNLYNELVQTRSSLNNKISGLSSKLSAESDALTAKNEAHAELLEDFKNTKEQGANLLKSAHEERDNYKSQLSTECLEHKQTLERERNLREDVIAQDNENASLLERLAHTAVGFRLINSMLSDVVKTKAVVLKTVAFNFEQLILADNSKKMIIQTVALDNAVAPVLGFNADHVFGVIRSTTDSSSGELDANLAAVSHIEDARSVLSTLADPDSLVSPTFFMQMLYIRSLDLKVVLTDFIANPLNLTDENREAVKEFHAWVSSPSAIRSSTHTLVLDKNVWEAMEMDGEDALICQGDNKTLYDPVSKLKNLVLV